MIGQGDYVVRGVSTGGEPIAVKCNRPTDDGYIIPARTADGQLVAVSLATLNKINQSGIIGSTADGALAGLTNTGGETPLCDMPWAMGLGYEVSLYPTPYMLDLGYGDTTPCRVTLSKVEADHQTDQNAFHRRIVEEITGDASITGHTAAGVGGAYTLEHWQGNATQHYPFFANLPHHLTGFEGLGVVSLKNNVPEAGVWMHSNPSPFGLRRDQINGPAQPQMPGVPFVGSDPAMVIPIDINTERQVFMNLRPTLSIGTDIGIKRIHLDLQAWVVVMIGRMVDYNWVAPLQVSNTPVQCNYTLEVSPGPNSPCVATTAEGDIGAYGCVCECQSYNLDDCGLMGASFNAMRQGLGNTTFYPSCDADHPRYLREIALYGTGTKRVSATWVYENNFTEANLRSAFSITSSQTIAEWVATGYEGVTCDLAGNDATSLHADITATATISGINADLPASIEGTETLPDTAPVICVTEPPTPVLKVALASCDGYIRWLAAEHRGITTRAALASARANQSPQGVPWYAASAPEFWACAMYNSWINTGSLLTVLTDPALLEAGTLIDLPLRTDCIADGYDDLSKEFIFQTDTSGYRFDAYEPNCTDRYGDGPEFQTCPYDRLMCDPSYVLPPSWKATHPDYFCGHPTPWAEIARGGYEVGCVAYSTWPGPEDPLPDDDDWECDWFDTSWEETTALPRYYIEKSPRARVRLKLDGTYMTIRADYDTRVMREQSCIRDDGTLGFENDDDGDGSPPTITDFGRIAVGYGSRVEIPPSICALNPPTLCAGNALPRSCWSLMQGLSEVLCGCQPHNPGRIQVVGDGNAMTIYAPVRNYGG